MTIHYEKHTEYPNAILIRKFEGRVEVEDIINSWNYLFEKNMLTENIKGVINDISSCDLEMNMDSFKNLISFLKNHEVFKRIKLAVICTDPGKIIFPMIGESQEKELGIKPFSTLDAAEQWILTR